MCYKCLRVSDNTTSFSAYNPIDFKAYTFLGFWTDPVRTLIFKYNNISQKNLRCKFYLIILMIAQNLCFVQIRRLCDVCLSLQVNSKS